MIDYPPFPGLREDAFDFLRDLAENNRRDWFKPRKETFEDEVQWPLRCLVVDAARRASLQDLPLSGDPKHSLFRIYRDIRFSKNKQPYKTHVGAVLSRSGRRKDQGVLYVHVEPGDCFLAAGFWRPDASLLRSWRLRTAEHPVLFLEVQRRLESAGLSLDHGGETLKRMPRGFEKYADSDVADILKWKGFVVRRAFDDADLHDPSFTNDVVRMMQEALPLLEFGWELIDSTP